MTRIGRNTQHPLLMLLEASAIRPVVGLDEYWALQRRHGAAEDRWLDLAHYATRADAEAALDRVAASDHADRHELRVEHVRRKPGP